MQFKDIIEKKRNGEKLSRDEIEFFISGYTAGDIPDYQVSALLMAVYFQGLDREETFWLTDAMKRSGDVADLTAIPGIKVDKHSTGGVGDKTTLIVAPLCAACGVPVAKMSGRGLGFTGGTVDKMEAIPGFRTALEQTEFEGIVRTVGMSVIGQSAHIAAADKKLYALRDVTATVENIGLITSSIMSKKLASGSDAIVLDVKTGRGAFMKTQESARQLAEWMVDIGKRSGKKMAAFITDMEQPLGKGVGNSIEVMEAIDTLKGKGPEDITELSRQLAGYMIYIGGKAASHEEGVKMADRCIRDGSGLKQFRAFVQAQGGNPDITEDPSLFPQASCVLELRASGSGYVSALDAETVGKASQLSGAGRAKKEDPVDLAAGIILNKKVGDAVKPGDLLATLYANDGEKARAALQVLESAYGFSEQPPEKRPLIFDIIE
ncbi:MAG: thymidine phosphorylase [Firmicutes bacterium]|nr:thymidine phosphorylase [Bacillota bacterium]